MRAINKCSRVAILIVMAWTSAVPIPLFAQKPDIPSTTPAARTNRSVDVQGDGAQRMLDLATTARVRAPLQADSELKKRTIVVETVNGEVRLMGHVNSASNFARIKDVVYLVESVKTVENQVVVRELVKPL